MKTFKTDAEKKQWLADQYKSGLSYALISAKLLEEYGEKLSKQRIGLILKNYPGLKPRTIKQAHNLKITTHVGYPKETIEAVRGLQSDGMSAEEIASITGHSLDSVKHMLEGEVDQNFPEKVIERINDLYDSGKEIDEIVELTGYSTEDVVYMIDLYAEDED